MSPSPERERQPGQCGPSTLPVTFVETKDFPEASTSKLSPSNAGGISPSELQEQIAIAVGILVL